MEALTAIATPSTRTAVAVAVKYLLRNYLREGYASATKMVRSLQELAKPCYAPTENTKTPDATQLPTTLNSQVPDAQSTVLIPHSNQPTASNTSASPKGFPIKSPRQMQLIVCGTSVIALVALSVISANPPQQKPSSTTQEKTIQETQRADGTNTQKSTPDNISQQNQLNNCFIVTRASNVRSVSGRRRTGKVIKAGTRVTATGREEGGWIELSAPEPGWIWKSRTKNTCQ
ncbi:hypothetical protein [Scytonema sp. UIC 10036]|uniref:hypothetical protein n=1 Tax=Scytonema sp. UIC 10036 TaxID=2304196 RepID=UPI00325C232A